MTAQKVFVEILGGGSAAESLRDIVLGYTEYKIFAEEQRTKRRGIEARETTTIAQIEARRDVLVTYLQRSFDERAENFRILFCKVDQAIADGDSNQLGLVLHSITAIAKSSPFKDLADLPSVRTALDDPDHEWTF